MTPNAASPGDHSAGTGAASRRSLQGAAFWYSAGALSAVPLRPWFQAACFFAVCAHLLTTLNLLSRNPQSRFDALWIRFGFPALYLVLAALVFAFWEL